MRSQPSAGRSALAHNGVLRNDHELRRTNRLPNTNVETDCYVAVQLVEQEKEVTFDSLRIMAEAVEGSFVFTVLDQENSLYFVKGDNPLSIYHYPKLSLYLYASTEGILFSALKTLGMEVIQPEEGEILRIDQYGEQSYMQFAMADSWSAWTPPVWEAAHAFGRRQWPYNFQAEYIQELKHIAGCCGYSAEEIDNLLADGYTTDDIEEMLY